VTETVREWLPVDVTEREPVRASISAAVADWSGRWFSKRTVSASRYVTSAAASRSAVDGSGWRRPGRTIAIDCPRRVMSKLLDWSLDARLDQLLLTPLDRKVVQSFEKRLLEDLASSVETALAYASHPAALPLVTDDPFGGRGGLEVGLADGEGDPLLSLAIPLDTLLPLCKSMFPERVRRSVRLDSMLAALSSVRVPVEVNLGRAEVSIKEIQALAPGDILILDTILDDGALLNLSGSTAPFARGQLGESENHRALIIQD